MFKVACLLFGLSFSPISTAATGSFPDGILVFSPDGQKLLVGHREAYFTKHQLKAGSKVYLVAHDQRGPVQLTALPSGNPYRRFVSMAAGIPKLKSKYGFLSHQVLPGSPHVFHLDSNDGKRTKQNPEILTVRRDQKKIATVTIVKDVATEGEWDVCDIVVAYAGTSKNPPAHGKVSPCELGLIGDLNSDRWPELVIEGGNAASSVLQIYPKPRFHFANFGS